MISVCKEVNSCKLAFKATSISSKDTIKNLRKQIIKKYLSLYKNNPFENENNGFNSSYASNMISFSLLDENLAKTVEKALRNKYFITKRYTKSVSFNKSTVRQYMVEASLSCDPSEFKDYLLKQACKEIFEKTGYVPKVEGGYIVVSTTDFEKIDDIISDMSQAGRVAIRAPGSKKMLDHKNQPVSVGKILFSNFQGEPLFDKCVDKNKHVFIFLSSNVLYELRMMLRVGEAKDMTLYLECDGTIYGSLVLNEQNLLKQEVLLASFDDDVKTQKFARKLRHPLPKLQLQYTEFLYTNQHEKMWAALFLLSIAIFLLMVRNRRKALSFILSSIFFAAIIYHSTVGILHMKMLGSIVVLSSIMFYFLRGMNSFIVNNFLIMCFFILRYFLSGHIIASLFLSSASQLLLYQNLTAFIYSRISKLSSRF
jgi:hypothetical protein